MKPALLFRPALLAFGLGLLVLLPFLGRPLISREQELRVVLTARDMARGADWLVPHYLGEPRLNKPPVQYWLTALAFRAGGTTRSPALARLPTALLGAALLAAMASLGARLLGPRRAIAAALLAGTTVLFWRFGRLAETDIPLACFETVAVLALFRAATIRATGAAWPWWCAAGVAAGLGFMVKGPAAVALPAAAWLTFRYSTPRTRRAPHAPWPLLAACALCLLIAAPWYAYVRFGQAGAAAVSDITSELTALGPKTKHAASAWFYVYTLPLMMLPWGVLLPFALSRAWRLARRHDGARWALGWLLSSFLVMTLVPSRQVHYATLLLAPAAFVIAAAFAPRLSSAPRAQRRHRVAFAIGVLSLAAFWTAAAVLHERSEPSRIVTRVAADVDRLATPESRVFFAGRRPNSMRYYLDRPLFRVASLDEGLQQASDRDMVVLAADARNPVLPAAAPAAPLVSCRQGGVVMQVFRGIKPAAPGPAEGARE